eukprot:11154-Eustigmatos_ZCMA.PRE.1
MHALHFTVASCLCHSPNVFWCTKFPCNPWGTGMGRGTVATGPSGDSVAASRITSSVDAVEASNTKVSK